MQLRGGRSLAKYALLGLALSGITSCSPEPMHERPRGYTTSRVARGDISQIVMTTGQLAPLVSVDVSSQISGLVTEVLADFNSPVKRGQVLAKIDSSNYEQRLRQAQADLVAAQASYSLASVNARRFANLRAEDLVTQLDFDEVEAQRKQSQAVLVTRKAAVENAKLELARCTIMSPIDGEVIYKQVEVGKTIVSNFSAPTLFTVAKDLSKMRIVAPLSEADIRLVRIGQPAAFTIDAIQGKTFQGHIAQIRTPYVPSDKAINEQRSNVVPTFDAVIEVDNSELLLRPSLTTNVSIVVARKTRVLRIPNGALRVSSNYASPAPARSSADAPQSAMVYRLRGSGRDATAESVRITLGMSDSNFTEVLSGLHEGESVITGALSRDELPKFRGLF